MSDDIRVLLVDDQQLIRLGFRMVLEAAPGVTVVGEAADGEAALEQVAALRPDVVLNISKEIVKETGYYNRTRRAAALALEHMRTAHENGRLRLDKKELSWLDRLADEVDDLPDTAEELTNDMLPLCEKLRPELYDL